MGDTWRVEALRGVRTVAAAVLPLAVVVIPGLLYGIRLNRAAAGGNDPVATMLAAIERGDEAAVGRLLDTGTSPNLRSPATGITPLIWASNFGDLEVMELLLSRGARIDVHARGYGTPLSSAAYFGRAPAVRLLLDRGADPNVGTSTGFTPLMMAAMGGNRESLDLLIRAGADVNARDGLGTTALSAAREAGDEYAVRRLIAAGAGRTSEPHRAS